MARSRTRQVAALPVRRGTAGALEVLLVTSRETRRWIIPKGWPINGLADHEAAAEEAWEEAGVHGAPQAAALGSFTYEKRRTSATIPVTVDVYLLEVAEQLATWPEAEERQRAWFALADAAGLVQEPGLKALLLGLAREA